MTNEPAQPDIMSTHRISKNIVFDEYWLDFLKAHSDPTNRACHYVGTSLVAFGILSGLFFIPILPALVICGLGLGLTTCGHFVYEQSRPHLSKPFLRVVCNLLMLYLFLFDRARLKQQFERLHQ